MSRWPGACFLLLLALSPMAMAAEVADPAATPSSSTPAATRSGRDIYAEFHAGLADPSCADDPGSPRWRKHYAAAPLRLATADDDVLALFGYVVDALRAASLPTEYALIPFVESGYRPDARSPGGPAGLWQMIALTARNHQVPIRAGYDGRLSPIDSTRAAVRYLKTLHGMFAGDWRLSVMAYNAGEYRVFGALKRSHQVARSADPDKLAGLSSITTAYVHKLHALSCLLDQADDRKQWLHALDRPVPVLDDAVLPPGTSSLDSWARANGRDPVRVRRLNPAFAGGRVGPSDRAQRVLVPTSPTTTPTAPELATTPADAPPTAADAAAKPRVHVVRHGDSPWKIAHRYGLTLAQLLARNGLDARSRLQPGMLLKLDDDPAE